MSKLVIKSACTVLAASFATFAGAGYADSLPKTDRIVVAQSQDQDPKTPPDCKKYPKDVRCKK